MLEERLPDEARLAGLRSRSTQLRLGLAQLEDERTSGAAALLALRQESDALLAGLRPLEELAAEVQLRTKEAAAAEELLVLVRRYAAAEKACAAVAERHGRARAEYQDRRQRWLDLREERLANAAAELASQLQAGVPCPVCGSPEHPVPAPAAASALDVAEAEQSAQHACEAAEAALAALERELSEAQQEVAVLAAQGGNTAPEDATLEAALAAERAAEARRAAADLAANRARHSELDEEIAGAERAQAATASSIAQTESTLAEVQEQADSLELALDNLRAGHPVLARPHHSAGRHRGRAGTRRRGADPAGTGRGPLRGSPAAAGAGASGHRLRVRGRGPGRPALRPRTPRRWKPPSAPDRTKRPGSRNSSPARNSSWRPTSWKRRDPSPRSWWNSSAQTRPRRNAQPGTPTLAAGLAEKSVRTLGTIAANYAQLAEAGREPRERAQLLAAVADAARGAGDNNYRMSLNSYVLAARLEQVAVAASERLIGMSDGRYTLQHTDARAARGAKSGLGLEVVDQWTGQRRDTATLSGGESFMASLALALGLADVVQQESGGVDIETLFVDEGFGSLDEQALEQVMDALEGLRDGGRVVGLVSHVGEMKQRISTQLQVVKGRNGSTLHISDDAPV